VATISGNTVTVVGVGTTTITASQGGNLNFNAATLVAQELKINASKPFANNAIPGVVEAENYDYGWEGYAYHDATPTNTGGAYRNDGVDLSECTDAGGGYQIQTTAAGEWVKYTVDVATSGNYVISTRCRAGNAGTTFRIEVDGVNKTGTLTVPNTSYGAWSNITDTINLTAGRHILRVYIISNIIHFNKFTFTSVSALKSMPLTGIVSPESADSYLTLSPNPLSGNSLTILYNLTVESNVRVAIYNLAGTVIYKTNLGERTAGDKNETLLLPSLPKGTYIVRIVTANGSRTEKLIHL
jgi:hypothetical protein